MINPPLLTVILPCYNSEHFLNYSIESVLSQSFNDFEFIIIDDGSTDNSLSVINSYKADLRIKVISQTNKGANEARKMGVNCALGQYITFIDADDTLMEDAFKNMFSLLGENDILVTRSKFNIVLKKEDYIIWTLDHLLPKELWGKLYKKSIFSEWVMTLPREMTIGEDFVWNIRLAFNVHTVKIAQNNFYNYQEINTTSLMKSQKRDVKYEEKFYNIIEQTLNDIGLPRDKIHNLLATQRFYTLLEIVRSKNPIPYNNIFIKKICTNSGILKGKLNIILYLIMNVPHNKIKIYLLRLYLYLKE